jgi:uncharacterized membrane protein
MRNKWLWITLLMVASVIFIAACAQATTAPTEQAPNDDLVETLTEEAKVTDEQTEPAAIEEETDIVDVEALIIERCSDCHSADRVFQADYDEQGRSDEIDDMVQKGAEVSEEEKALMIDWLISR